MRPLKSYPVLLLGGALIGIIPFTSVAGAEAQPPREVKSQKSSASAIAQLPPLSTRQEPAAYLPVSDAIDITLVNTSSSEIQFQAVGQTETRVLAPGEEVELSELSVPTHVRLAQEDGGLTQAEMTAVMTDEGAINVELSQAETLAEEVRSILVLETGVIYFL